MIKKIDKNADRKRRHLRVRESIAREALRLASYKLPIKCKIIAKETEAAESEVEANEA